MRERGTFIVVVGPDGVGKTTFSASLLETLGGRGRYFHFRPTSSRDLVSEIIHSEALPKNRESVNVGAGLVRLIAAIGRFWYSYLTIVRPAVEAGQVVIGDRWAYGYLVQPLSVRFGGPSWAARVAIRLMPQPSMIFNLSASPAVILARKAELNEVEILDELKGWETLPGTVVTFDATMAPAELAKRAVAFIDS